MLDAEANAVTGGKTVPGKHLLQNFHIAGDVQRITLEQLVQLLFKAFHDLIHHAFNALLGGGDVLAFNSLRLQLRIARRIFRVVGR